MVGKILISLTALALALPLCAQEWVLEDSYVNEYPQAPILYQWYNTESYAQTVEQSCAIVTYTKILGSALTPPWSAKFTPLTDQAWPVTFGIRGHVVPGETTCERYAVYVHEVGQETWSREHEEYVEIATRDRIWDTPSPVTIVHRHYAGPPQ